MKLTSTRKSLSFVNCLLYGRYGIGKTPLAATAPNPVIIDTEGGTLSISDLDLPMYEVRTMEQLEDVYDLLTGKKGKKYDTVVIDSGTELAEIVLLDLKEKHKDRRQAYMELGEVFIKILRKFKDLDKNLIVTAKMKISNADGSERYRANFPGAALGEAVPYLFDEVFCLRFNDDDDSEKEDENHFKVIQTRPSEDYDGKDRSTRLKKFEKPDLSYVFKKILNPDKKKKKKDKTSTKE